MSTATDMYAAYLAAELALLAGKEFRLTVNGTERVLKMEDLQFVLDGRREWGRIVDSENAIASGRPTFGGLGYAVARMDR